LKGVLRTRHWAAVVGVLLRSMWTNRLIDHPEEVLWLAHRLDWYTVKLGSAKTMASHWSSESFQDRQLVEVSDGITKSLLTIKSCNAPAHSTRPRLAILAIG
jgi:hypothetical protein